MRRREALREYLLTLKPQLARDYNVSRIGIFGSVARDEHSGASDLDLLVAFDGPVSLFDIVRLEQELESRLEVEVDVVTEGSLKPHIGERVADDLVEV
jgi:predicted nucleotidyltransferase